MSFAFLKNKKIYIPAVIVVAAIGLGYHQYKKTHQPPEYETTTVTRGDLVQTVQATGKLASVDDIDLRFETPGSIGQVVPLEGATVTAESILATLRLGEANASVAEAKANLNQKLAGATSEDRTYYQAAMESARASYEQSKIDSLTAVTAAQAAVDTAKNNLKLASGADQSQIVTTAYQTAVTTLQTTVSKLDDALTQADNILGIDNTFANTTFKSLLSNNDISKLNIANGLYLEAKTQNTAVRLAVGMLTINSSHNDIDAALDLAGLALAKMNRLLAAVLDVLNATSPLGDLSQSSLDTKKSTIATTRSGIAAQYTAIINQKQSIADAKNSVSTYTVAYNKAMQDLEAAEANASTTVALKEAVYTQALATYQGKINPPREVDVAPLRAALAAAVANREKAIIRAPFDGVVTKISKKVGETVSTADVVMNMLSPHFEIKVDVPETDVAKLMNGGGNRVDFTVDAFGEERKFTGRVITIEKKSTEIQDVVYYQVRIAVDSEHADTLFKSGMTANVTIHTASRSGVLFVPLRTVRTRANGSKYVRILENGTEKEVSVTIGLRADDNKAEILSGLAEGQTIIIDVKSNS